MPSVALFLTQQEYDEILTRTKLLESHVSALAEIIATHEKRMQSLESTLSAYQQTMATMTVTTKTGGLTP